MFTPHNRRHFVKGALSAGALAGLGDFAFLGRSAAHRRGRRPRLAGHRTIRPGGRAAGAPHRGHAAGETARRRSRQDPRRDRLPAAARRRLPGRRAQHPAAAGRLRVPLRAGRPLRPPGGAGRAGRRPLAGAVLGDERVQKLAGGEEEQGAWTMPVLQEANCRRPTAPARTSSRRWTPGTRRRPTGPSPPWCVRRGPTKLFELLVRYGARDFRVIGHKAIYVANAIRTLNTIGWRHAEPVLRSVAFALLAHEAGNPAKDDLEPDRPWRENVKKAAHIRRGWQRGKVDAGSVGRPAGRLAQRRPSARPPTRWSSCSTRKSTRRRSGTACSWRPANC